MKLLSKRPALHYQVIMAVVARLDDEDLSVRHDAVQALGQQSTLPDEVLVAIVTWLSHKELYFSDSEHQYFEGDEDTEDEYYKGRPDIEDYDDSDGENYEDPHVQSDEDTEN